MIPADSQKELYRQFFLHAPVGLGISDAAGVLIDFNDALLAYSGWTREEMAAVKNVVDLYADGEKERDRLLGLAREQGGNLDRVEVRFKRKGGGTFLSLMSLRMVAVGDMRYWLAMIEDVTELRRAQSAKEQYAEEMERVARLVVDREQRMIALKKRIEELENGGK